MPKDLSGLGAGTVQQDPVNDPSVRVIRGKNLFPQSFRHPSTCRYGEVDPMFAAKCERGDVYPYKFVSDLNTYTLASPVKSDVNMYTAAFKVPMDAIYPRNWRDVMYPMKNKGDDEPMDNIYSLCRAILPVGALANTIISKYGSSSVSHTSYSLDYMVRAILLLEKMFSAGGIFAKFNLHLNTFRFQYRIPSDDNVTISSFDKFFDTCFAPWLKKSIVDNSDVRLVPLSDSDGYFSYFVVSDGSYQLSTETPVSQGFGYVTFRRALELLRTGDYFISVLDSSSIPFPEAPRNLNFNATSTSFYSLHLNIEPIVAYQLVGAHFFSNSKVDSVYTASLYRDLMQTYLIGDDGIVPSFNFNGIYKLYDVFSLRFFRLAIDLLNHSSLDTDIPDGSWHYFYNLFSFVRSLRYGDYFTAAHPEPIAPGDINAPVIDNSVNALDMTRKLQLARLLNKVNITGPRFDDYLLALFGGKRPEAPKDVPIRLSLESSRIEGFEVNNTGSEQASPDSRNITTTNLRTTESKYMFEVNIDEPCWLLSMRYFDAERIYSNTCDRFAFHYDRFDDFIPDMQFEGDQDVSNTELDITRLNTPFAYNLRYMEYKNRYSYASGGFIEFLPSWSFITDNKDGAKPAVNINSEYIRSSPSEFDRFYKSFAGAYSLASHFHFIIMTTNVAAPYRQMVYAPEILA